MSAYYNEIDAYAAQWLRNLIAGGHIAPGDVDERSIQDVHPNDLKPYTQCHFFAGIGVWSLALRRAGWPDDRPVWTGSCPCQPFSSAGQGAGFDDERHLWPDFHWLIQERRPPVVFGEQVASKDADPWVDLVQTDVETMGYSFGAVPFPSAGFGAPHIRDRLYWVADSGSARPFPSTLARIYRGEEGARPRDGESERHVTVGGMADANSQRLDGVNSPVRAESLGDAQAARCGETLHDTTGSHRRICGLDGKPIGLGDPQSLRQSGRALRARSRVSEDGIAKTGISERLADTLVQQRPDWQPGLGHEHDQAGRVEGAAALAGFRGDLRPGPTNGLWADADWLFCRDGKWRPVEPGTFPLADGATARVGRLRAYGNAINAEAATHFVAAYLDTL